jgi:tetratricopeptide (TPR) repeat protein
MFLLLAAPLILRAQTALPDLKARFAKHNTDTAGVELLRQMSLRLQATHPDSALLFARQGIDLARKINFKKGEGDCLDRLGVVLWKNGKYDLALQYLLNSLELREKIEDKLGQLKSLNDIGIVYSDQKDYKKALYYHLQAKAIAESLHNKRLLSIILSNIGNGYIKLHQTDSALVFEMQAYELQHSLNDQDTQPNTLSILGDINDKMGHRALALEYYRLSIFLAIKYNDQSGLADTYTSVAQLYKKSGQLDSAVYYAGHALAAAKTAAYPEGVYNASNLLSQLYQGKNEHLELLYFKTATTAKDSLFNAEKIKQVQSLSFSEATRQQELAEEKRAEAENRIINLQLIGIAIFIPSFFLLLLVLSKSRTHRRVIEFMGVLSLLLVFEFLTLFIHPFVMHISNHLPIVELVILVSLAAILVPLHHRLTHWLREKLVHTHQLHNEKPPVVDGSPAIVGDGSDK